MLPFNPSPDRAVFIDPSYREFYSDKLFDLEDKILNRDDMLSPMCRLREFYAERGIPVHTADLLRSGKVVAKLNDYWSLGMVDGQADLASRPDVRLRAFIMLEPPLVKPKIYADLANISTRFENIYLHNTNGDGYELTESMAPKIRQIFWPQPYGNEVEPFWSRSGRSNKLVVIAGNHNPRLRKPEFYSERIKAVAALIGNDSVDLFGRGWSELWSRHAAWPTYLLNRRSILKAYRGPCISKLDTLSNYKFSLCFENAPMSGYVTEKIFDCFYAGTVPIYLGAPDINLLVPDGAYIDMRKYSSYVEMFSHVQNISQARIAEMREIGRDFLRSEGRKKYADFFINIARELEN